jgi:hypothetical protein
MCSSAWEGISEAVEGPGSGRSTDEGALCWVAFLNVSSSVICAQEVSDLGGFRISEFRMRDIQPVSSSKDLKIPISL